MRDTATEPLTARLLGTLWRKPLTANVAGGVTPALVILAHEVHERCRDMDRHGVPCWSWPSEWELAAAWSLN